MVYVGLTGGIGSGKTEVARQLRACGAVVIDSDQLAREVVEPGTTGLSAVLSAFGAEVLREDGSLDRERIAQRVFSDEDARHCLNAIMHPLIRERAASLRREASEDDVVVHDVPLLVENQLQNQFDAVIVVTAPMEHRLQRLVARGMARADAAARIAAQASDEQRRKVADFVMNNDGDLTQLAQDARHIWRELMVRNKR